MHIYTELCVVAFVLSIYFGSIDSLCPCDRTIGVCDQNCCCDKNCTQDDLSAFRSCHVSTSPHTEEDCIHFGLLFNINSGIRNYQTTDRKQCFIEKKYEQENFYKSPSVASTTNETVLLTVTYAHENPSFRRNTKTLTQISETPYKEGKPMIVIFNNGLFGFFEMPTNNPGEVCTSFKELEFLSNSSGFCKRVLVTTDNGTSCRALQPISQFTTGFQFLQPSLYVNTTGSESPSTMSHAFVEAFQLQSVSCKTPDGRFRTCPNEAPTFDPSTNLCSNVLTEISYVFLISNERLVQVNVEAVIQDGLNQSFNQAFRAYFIENTTSSIPTPSSVPPEAHLSGSPGYIKRLPVRAGVNRGSYLEMMPPVPIELKEDRQWAGGQSHGWWPVISGGKCQSPAATNSQILPIRFGVDMKTTCLLSYGMNLSAGGELQACAALQDRILSILNKPYAGSDWVPTHVARWGNSSTTNTSDWVPIIVINSQANTTIVAGKRSCHNIVVGKTILFIYAKRGRVHKAQREILSVFKTYHYGTISFKCGGRYCTPNNAYLQQTAPIHTVVHFHDATVAPNSRTKTVPMDETDLTGDLYYPFNVESAASWSNY